MHTNTDTKIDWIVCLFGVDRSTREFILIWKRHHYRLRVANFNRCSVYRLYGHWTARVLYTPTVTSLKWSSPRTHDSHTFCRAFSSGAITTCFLNWDSNTLYSACGADALAHCTIAAVVWSNGLFDLNALLIGKLFNKYS